MTPLVPAALLALQAATGGWREAPPLPRPVTSNAVAAVETDAGTAVVSLVGLAPRGTGSEMVDWAFRWDTGTDAWREVGPVPGPARQAATAAAVGGRVYLFGGYAAADDGSGTGLDRVDVYDPATDTWTTAAPLPVPVDDAVSGVWRDSLVYLVGGRHDGTGETVVRVYEPATDRWREATPVPGVPVVGHAGAVARDAIVYIDGAGVGAAGAASDPPGDGGRRLVTEGSSWRGDIDPADPVRITWRRLPDHPGPPRYRAAAAAVGTRVVFVGGGDTPYEHEGPGGDAVPSEPVRGALVYDLVSGAWDRTPGPPDRTMDHRALARAGGWLVLPGGMTAGPAVSDRVWIISVLDLVAGGR